MQPQLPKRKIKVLHFQLELGKGLKEYAKRSKKIVLVLPMPPKAPFEIENNKRLGEAYLVEKNKVALVVFRIIS